MLERGSDSRNATIRCLECRLDESSQEPKSWNKEHRLILEEAWSFRGGGDVTSGIIDMREQGAAQVKVYDLIGLLANFEVTLIDQAKFYEIVARCELPRRAYERHDLVSYWRSWGVRPERKNIQIVFNQDIADWGEDDFGVAQVVEHVEVDAQGVEGLTTMNRHLARRKMVALLCPPPASRTFTSAALAATFSNLSIRQPRSREGKHLLRSAGIVIGNRHAVEARHPLWWRSRRSSDLIKESVMPRRKRVDGTRMRWRSCSQMMYCRRIWTSLNPRRSVRLPLP